MIQQEWLPVWLDTAGMAAGMVASGVTAKGLNGIEAGANKLAKAPKGIDGV